MTSNDLYQEALKDLNSGGYGSARHVLQNGDVLICSIDKVAGRSVIKKHFRTNWLHKSVHEKYSHAISRLNAVKMLQAEIVS